MRERTTRFLVGDPERSPSERAQAYVRLHSEDKVAEMPGLILNRGNIFELPSS